MHSGTPRRARWSAARGLGSQPHFAVRGGEGACLPLSARAAGIELVFLKKWRRLSWASVNPQGSVRPFKDVGRFGKVWKVGWRRGFHPGGETAGWGFGRGWGREQK